MVLNSSVCLPDKLAEYPTSEVVSTLQTIVSDDLGYVINTYINTLITRLRLNPDTNINSFALYIAMMSAFVYPRSSVATLAILKALPAVLDRIGKEESDSSNQHLAREFRDQVYWFIMNYSDYCARHKSRLS